MATGATGIQTVLVVGVPLTCYDRKDGGSDGGGGEETRRLAEQGRGEESVSGLGGAQGLLELTKEGQR